ncbi:AMP-binding protein [Saccharothrix sp. NRRL B-16314]|uniref:AMP-binding protein n=1 Tax=Saccharothrix sp. NRRL B-16314 TaxID=1463825 RepID=UPI00068FCAA9|nr:AMP-binding protein [Saccharothrix sp. NRRL B-16314]
MLVHDLLDDAIATAGAEPAVRVGTLRWTYRRLGELSTAFARWLGDNGVRRGDRVVVVSPPAAGLAAMLFGCSRLGAVLVPLDPAMRPFHLSAVLGDADPALVLADDIDRIRGLARCPIRDRVEAWAEASTTPVDRDALATGRVSPDDLALLIYTSGSTATPKAVMCPHSQVTFVASAINAELRYRRGDVVFSRLPMSWDYGLHQVLLCCLGRAELVVAQPHDDLRLLDRVRDSGATVLPLVPSLATMITTLWERGGEQQTAVRMITSTGAVLSQPTIDALRKVFPGARVVRQFGQTECKRISIMPPEEDRERPGSVGRPLPGTAVRVLGPDGTELPCGATGEIVVNGPHVMPGYWRAPELTARTFRVDRDGRHVLHTGDQGHLDEDGYLYFDGRHDGVFKRKGVRVSTTEVEAAATDIRGVRAAVVLAPSDHHDLTVCVEGDVDSHAVLRELAARLEPAKVPATCLVVPRLPLTGQGKPATDELHALLEGTSR